MFVTNCQAKILFFLSADIINFMKTNSTIKNFGKRLTELRKAKGLTQTELGNKIGVSKRVLSYYEGVSKYPPTHLIVPMAKTLHVSTDELLGVKGIKPQLDPEYAALWRRLKKAENLSIRDRKALLRVLDALVKRNMPKTKQNE